MKLKQLFVAVPAALLVLGSGTANAGQTTNEAGALACVTDKWDEKEPEKGHKLADAVMRCVVVPDDPALEKYAQDCVGKYEYMPDGSWKAAGSCTKEQRQELRDLGGGLSPQGVHVQENWGHQQI